MLKCILALTMLIIGTVFPPALLVALALLGWTVVRHIRKFRPAPGPNLDGWDPATGLAYRSPSEWARVGR